MRWNLFALVVVSLLLLIEFRSGGNDQFSVLQIQIAGRSAPFIVLLDDRRPGLEMMAVEYYPTYPWPNYIPFALIWEKGSFRIQKRRP